MSIAEREIATVLSLSNWQLISTPAEYSGILVGVRGRIAIVRERDGLEGVG